MFDREHIEVDGPDDGRLMCYIDGAIALLVYFGGRIMTAVLFYGKV